MKITVLIENCPDPGNLHTAEYGLSVYVENEGFRFLIDTGQSGNFINNAVNLGIDLSEVDNAIITHGHYDHINGLPGFLKTNSKAKIILSPIALEKEFFSVRQGSEKYIGEKFPTDLIDIARLVFVTTDINFEPGLGIMASVNVEIRESMHGKYLMSSSGKKIRDDFTHEIIPYFITPNGAVVFTGCAHQGLFSILQTVCAEIAPQKIIAVVGGFHLPGETDEKEIDLLAGLLEAHFPETLFYTGHCTGKTAYALLKSRLGGRLYPIHTGSIITIN